MLTSLRKRPTPGNPRKGAAVQVIVRNQDGTCEVIDDTRVEHLRQRVPDLLEMRGVRDLEMDELAKLDRCMMHPPGSEQELVEIAEGLQEVITKLSVMPGFVRTNRNKEP